MIEGFVAPPSKMPAKSLLDSSRSSAASALEGAFAEHNGDVQELADFKGMSESATSLHGDNVLAREDVGYDAYGYDGASDDDEDEGGEQQQQPKSAQSKMKAAEQQAGTTGAGASAADSVDDLNDDDELQPGAVVELDDDGKAAQFKEEGNMNFRWARMVDYENAVAIYSQGMLLKPSRPILAQLYGNRAAALLRLKQYEAAEADARQAIMLAPDSPKGFFRLAEALTKQKKATNENRAAVKRAREQCEWLCKKNPAFRRRVTLEMLD